MEVLFADADAGREAWVVAADGDEVAAGLAVLPAR